MMGRWLAGLLAAALLLWFVAGVANRLLPPDLSRWEQRSQVVTDAEGRLLRPFPTTEGFWRLPTSPQQVDPLYLAMLMAVEDQRFGLHPGVDPLAVLRAIGQRLTQGHVVSGASTLTMQAARLLDPKPRTLTAKLAESLRALQLQHRLGREGVLQVYLTLAPFGGTLEGVRSASWGWFGKEPEHLTAAEAALLVALPQRPEALRPDRFPQRARAARDRVLDRAVERGVISLDAALLAKSQPLPTTQRSMPLSAAHLAEALRRRSPPEQKELRSFIQRPVQATLQTIIDRATQGWEDGVEVAAVVVRTADRQVIAHLGSRDWLRRPLDLTQAVRSPGSSLKPLIYALAFDDQSLHPGTLVYDGPRRFGSWQPRNFDRDFRGMLTVREALQQSLNVPAVLALDKVGPLRFATIARQAGLPLFLPGDGEAGLPLALGGVGVRLVDMATIYANLADDGMVRPLAWGPDVTEPALAARRLVGQAAARAVLTILTDSPAPDGQIQRSLSGGRRSVAFKTGTSFGFRDAWTVAMSPDYTVVIWVGRPDGAPRPGHLGRTTAAPLALRVLDALPMDRRQKPAISEPDNALYAAEPPAALARMELDSLISPQKRQPLQIIFPPDGAAIERLADGVLLQASGGEAPIQWAADGIPLPPPVGRGSQFWQPAGEGFYQLAAIDAKGRRAEVRVRVLP